MELAQTAFDAGIRYFDTAPAYNDGQSELNYGEALAGGRDQVFLATKLGQRTYDAAIAKSRLASSDCERTTSICFRSIVRESTKIGVLGKTRRRVQGLGETAPGKGHAALIGVTGHENADTMCQAITMYAFDTILPTFNPTEKRPAPTCKRFCR